MEKKVLANCLFFGCWSSQQKGHFLHNVNGGSSADRTAQLPFAQRPSYVLDGLFKPKGQSVAMVMNIPGWSLIWMEDCSGDDRPGSCAAFLVPLENLGFEEIKTWARASFPHLVERIEAKAPIKAYEP